jgi:hypothetical protein
VLELQTLGNDDTRQFILTFEGPKVDLLLQAASGFKASLQGTADPAAEDKP